ncbi:Wzz/FepE/Etk N-terminal domain-containing protein [Marinobacter sp. X15-166B]|uniref:Wzz/FepE/Etk N-terminal domain-containing protein n=1 Tax=Marinobacter sp. X15-166B TaxID=1897620 RepID=UPI00085C45C8|nr:Wzz/FepE/Etk N-terminal domain-containing protein [Marinobacter sp. X15-166B]OEY65164.1 lipopolysaccharide biosynthesis protein [Marinobacter sp. X15-166B]
MNESLPQRTDYADEISLVDLATTFIRRRYVFYVVSITVTLSGIAYALLAPEKYEYISLIQVAQKNSDEPIQSVESTIATLESRWLPEVATIYRAKHGNPLPLSVTFSNPKNTGLIRFATEAKKTEADTVTATHQALIESVKRHQDGLIKHAQTGLARQMDSLEQVLNSLRGQQNAGEALAAALEKRTQLESMAESLRSVEVLVTSRESAARTSPKRSLIVVLAVLLGGMMGVFMAFMSEFFVAVREQLITAEPE